MVSTAKETSILTRNYELSDNRTDAIEVEKVISEIGDSLSYKNRVSHADHQALNFSYDVPPGDLFNKKDSSLLDETLSVKYARQIGVNNLNDLYNAKINALSKRSIIKETEYFKQTQNWVGHIIQINDNEKFTAKLEDLNDPGTYEEAEFYFKDVSPDDQSLISLGSIFYWSVGYAVRIGGQVKKESLLRFQRLPAWNVAEFDKIVDASSALRARLKWE